MQASALQTTAAVAALAVGVCAAGLLRMSAQRAVPPMVESQLDIPPIPGDVARPLAFGFHSMLADFTFIEAIQVLALRKPGFDAARSAGIDRRLLRLLDYSVEVDPKFAGAYRFAGAALPHLTLDGKAVGVLAAISILRRGARERPDEWHVPFLLGFIQAYYLADYAEAGKNLALAARGQGAPAYLGLLATRVAAQGGELDTALALARAMLAQANEEDTRREWTDRLQMLLMERDLREIEAAAARFKADHGSWPSSVHALVAAGYLAMEPHEPHGGRYEIDAAGNARSTAAERLRVYGATHFEVH